MRTRALIDQSHHLIFSLSFRALRVSWCQRRNRSCKWGRSCKVAARMWSDQWFLYHDQVLRTRLLLHLFAWLSMRSWDLRLLWKQHCEDCSDSRNSSLFQTDVSQRLHDLSWRRTWHTFESRIWAQHYNQSWALKIAKTSCTNDKYQLRIHRWCDKKECKWALKNEK